jgi:pteridine reductase
MRALVTGAGIRVGAAIARALAAAGMDVIVHTRSSPADETVAAVQAAGRAAWAVQADLGTEAGCAQLAAQVQALGGLDVLVHSAAAYTPAALPAVTAADFDAMMALNCRAALLLARDLHPLLAQSALPGGGLLLTIADIGAERPAPGFLSYAVSKAALVMLTRALALELAPRVRVNAISPGTVMAPDDLGPAQLERLRASIPAGRFGSGDDIGALAAFLARHAPYVTGQVWAVDGGRSLAGPLALDRPEPPGATP